MASISSRLFPEWLGRRRACVGKGGRERSLDFRSVDGLASPACGCCCCCASSNAVCIGAASESKTTALLNGAGIRCKYPYPMLNPIAPSPPHDRSGTIVTTRTISCVELYTQNRSGRRRNYSRCLVFKDGDGSYRFDEFAKSRFVANGAFRGADNVIAKRDEPRYFGRRGGINVEDMEHIRC